MAIIKCYECGNEMSEYADICPKCGCPNRLKQARKRAVYREKQRVAAINNTIEYYSEQAMFGIVALIISLLLGYGFYKWQGEGSIVLVFLFSIMFFWCYIVMTKFQVGLFASLLVCCAFMMGIVKVLSNTPLIVQNLFAFFLLIYPLYYTIMRPIINVFKIRNEKNKL